ncbi:MAG: 50S ribosomal protein L24 [Deltaproteobacteria bacterium HGW-Deltaproteobacteria-20]|jgi:large subunit ribosomal protein L24|nr:MAG: 50S ribosomal protein L24 [Deltaproteobacteria bacterium HGW-Deltaproteobacteria-20]
MQRIRRGDMVQVISGKYKGAKGRILSVLRDEDKVLVEGVNVKKRHVKPNARMPQGGIIEREAPIHACKVMPVDPESGKPTRVRIRTNDEGKKERIAVKSGAVLVANS